MIELKYDDPAVEAFLVDPKTKGGIWHIGYVVIPKDAICYHFGDCLFMIEFWEDGDKFAGVHIASQCPREKAMEYAKSMREYIFTLVDRIIIRTNKTAPWVLKFIEELGVVTFNEDEKNWYSEVMKWA